MGMMYEAEKKEALLGRAFSYFYAAINIGSAVTSLGLPLVRNRAGYGLALAIPAALMALALVFFASGRRFYPKETVAKAAVGPKVPAIWSREQRPVLAVFLFIAVFWFVYDQTASTWVFFARDHMNLELWKGVSVTPDQIQGLNAVMILALTPAFNWLWRALRDRRGAEVRDTDKMTLGFGIVFVCMATMAVAGALAGAGKVSAWWAIAATAVITMAELCISVVGLEFAFRRAATGTKSAITAAFHCMVFVGDSFGGLYDQIYEHVTPATYFALQAAIIAVAGIAFRAVVARMFRAGSMVRPVPPEGEPVAA
jgi:POT family proton-dependent oligopeptide transporter